MPTLFAPLVPPLVFFERMKIIMAHRWLWYWQKRTNVLSTQMENHVTWLKRRLSQCLHTAFAVYTQYCCCAVATHSWLFACIFNWKRFHNAYVVFMDESTALVLRSYHHNIATIIRNQCVNVTATALQMQAKSQRQHWDACWWRKKAQRQHCDKVVAEATLNIPKQW